MKCLIVERHSWETGGNQTQLQIPLGPAANFFGPSVHARAITVRLVERKKELHNCSVSKKYRNGTRRINSLPLIGELADTNCFLFFQETDDPNIYDCWWREQKEDMTLIAAHFDKWGIGKRSQYGRGRLYQIVKGTVSRRMKDLEDF
jgi:hypothetical protein